ncbi:hypothetical protein EV122DRAFT_226153 [Schizophyllum commune]
MSPPKRRRSGRQVIEDDDDEEEAPEPPPVAISDEEEDEAPVPAPKKGKGRTVEDEDEPRKKGKKDAEDTTPANTKKTRPVDVTPVDAKKRTVSAKSTPAEPSPSAPPFGSGKKGDATTRIKKPKPKVVELSDVESDEAPVIIQKKKKKAKEATEEKEKPSRKTGRKSVAMLEDSEDDDEVASPAPEKSKPKGKEKRKPKEDDAMEVDDDEEEAEEAEKPAKKGKKGKRAAHDEEDSEIRMMTTGISLPDNVVHALNKLGVKVVTKPHECTHLVVARIVRTSKFLCALPHVSHLVSEEWARQSAAQKKLLPESDFPVVDKEGEKKQRIKLAEVVERARALKGKLFAGHTFFITHKTTMDRDLLRSIITANSGQLSSTNAPTVRTFKNDPKTKHLISSKEDAPVWRPIASEGFKVYTGEVVLDSALRQEVDWDNESYVLPEAKS